MFLQINSDIPGFFYKEKNCSSISGMEFHRQTGLPVDACQLVGSEIIGMQRNICRYVSNIPRLSERAGVVAGLLPNKIEKRLENIN
jgi:hypothetical protein